MGRPVLLRHLCPQPGTAFPGLRHRIHDRHDCRRRPQCHSRAGFHVRHALGRLRRRPGHRCRAGLLLRRHARHLLQEGHRRHPLQRVHLLGQRVEGDPGDWLSELHPQRPLRRLLRPAQRHRGGLRRGGHQRHDDRRPHHQPRQRPPGRHRPGLPAGMRL